MVDDSSTLEKVLWISKIIKLLYRLYRLAKAIENSVEITSTIETHLQDCTF